MAQRPQLLDVPACGLFLLYVWLWPGVRLLPEGVSDMVLRPLEAVAHVAALIPFETFAATTVPFEIGSNYHNGRELQTGWSWIHRDHHCTPEHSQERIIYTAESRRT